jgi:hypothetical protein
LDYVRLVASFPMTVDIPVRADGTWGGTFIVPSTSNALPTAVSAACFTGGQASQNTQYQPNTFTVTSGSAAPASGSTTPAAPAGSSGTPAAGTAGAPGGNGSAASSGSGTDTGSSGGGSGKGTNATGTNGTASAADPAGAAKSSDSLLLAKHSGGSKWLWLWALLAAAVFIGSILSVHLWDSHHYTNPFGGGRPVGGAR